MDKKTYQNQLRRVYEAFKEKPKTMLQVALETNIYRANICWFVRDLRQEGKIAVVREGRCPISNHQAQFLSTDPDQVKHEMEKQPTLF